ncbi:SPL2 (YHR136C) [Zygosaccharomyces parabailii]|uniref:BN860_14774g1_1 n=1 Tax=Zygosaccharomyces bailii (strain CLIB 213 / ATCC 58445 / CBS 680 / BCRC 21525 / NBRC 1098 / NCYC 1416 / NRRL Y-2227) TaxID=1333698 RepID=A0A8J2X7I1_ZYGB2|nr:SPL2 (YHR136C) [Zygosaccharomyces parabailii]CDF88632.1 BN860_14774g1_1 [Zygosaccharomyces bailii CLIB 213]
MSAAEEDLLFQFSPEMPFTYFTGDKYAPYTVPTVKTNSVSPRVPPAMPSRIPSVTPSMAPSKKPSVGQPAGSHRITPRPMSSDTSYRERQLKLQELMQERRKLEEMADRYWLKDGEISEDMFESSSDEENA